MKEKENLEKLMECTLRCTKNGLFNKFLFWLVSHGANYYTMRDKLLYKQRTFRSWEVIGVKNMILRFAPDYDGDPKLFWNTLEKKTAFVTYMKEEGGMCRTSCYALLPEMKFKPWQWEGLDRLAAKFMEEHSINKEE